MDTEKLFYEAPVTDVIVVNTEAGILQGSTTGNRNGYGPANQQEWD